MLINKTISRTLRIATLAAVFGAGVGAPSFAQSGGNSARVPAIVKVKAQVSTARNFNWFSNGQSASQARIAKASLTSVHSGRRLGHGSWICSPAGFGHKSHCIAR